MTDYSETDLTSPLIDHYNTHYFAHYITHYITHYFAHYIRHSIPYCIMTVATERRLYQSLSPSTTNIYSELNNRVTESNLTHLGCKLYVTVNLSFVNSPIHN